MCSYSRYAFSSPGADDQLDGAHDVERLEHIVTGVCHLEMELEIVSYEFLRPDDGLPHQLERRRQSVEVILRRADRCGLRQRGLDHAARLDHLPCGVGT